MKKLILLTVLLLAACSKDDKPFIDERVANQCLRRELFNECMKMLPAGPVATKYNDWDEVVGLNVVVKHIICPIEKRVQYLRGVDNE